MEIKEYLGQEISTPLAVSVDGTSIEISPAKYRKSIYIKNTSAGGQIINIVFSNTSIATTTTGFQLNPNEAIIEADSEGYKAWSGSIKAISSAAGGVLTIMER